MLNKIMTLKSIVEDVCLTSSDVSKTMSKPSIVATVAAVYLSQQLEVPGTAPEHYAKYFDEIHQPDVDRILMAINSRLTLDYDLAVETVRHMYYKRLRCVYPLNLTDAVSPLICELDDKSNIKPIQVDVIRVMMDVNAPYSIGVFE